MSTATSLGLFEVLHTSVWRQQKNSGGQEAILQAGWQWKTIQSFRSYLLFLKPWGLVIASVSIGNICQNICWSSKTEGGGVQIDPANLTLTAIHCLSSIYIGLMSYSFSCVPWGSFGFTERRWICSACLHCTPIMIACSVLLLSTGYMLHKFHLSFWGLQYPNHKQPNLYFRPNLVYCLCV